MPCRECRGTGKVYFSPTGHRWDIHERPCPACHGSGSADDFFHGDVQAPFSIKDIFLWGIISAVFWAAAGGISALFAFKPLGSMVAVMGLGGAMIGACAGILALFSFFGIFAVTGEPGRAYGIHLALMTALALAVGSCTALFALPGIAIPSGVVLQGAVVRSSVCGITAMVAMVISLRTIARFG